MLNLGCSGKEKEKKNGNYKCRRPEWATAHFESTVAIEEVCHDRVPLALCRDRVSLALCRDKGFHVMIGLAGQACNPARARMTAQRVSMTETLGPMSRQNFGVATGFRAGTE